MNGHDIERWQDIQVRGQLLGEGPRNLRVRRNDEIINLTIEPVMVRGGRLNQPRYILGVRPFQPPVIDQLREHGNARSIGFREGDEITALNGEPVQSWQELVNRLDEGPGTKELLVKKDGEVRTITMTVPEENFRDWFADMGWAPPVDVRMYGVIGSFRYGAEETWRIVRLMYETVVGLINQQISPQSLAGPIGIAQMTGQVSQQGFFSLLIFTAFFSINLGVINLLPIPALDGGHILMTLPELVTGDPLPDRVVGVVNYFGVVLLITLMLWVIKIDLCRFDWFTEFLGMVCR